MFEERLFEGLSYLLIVLGLLSPYFDKQSVTLGFGHLSWLIVNFFGSQIEGIRIQQMITSLPYLLFIVTAAI